jgi:O-antigen/teichoic acid export membrane protein
MNKKIHKKTQHLDKRLRRQFIIFALIMVISFVMMIYQILSANMQVRFICLGLVLGILLGLVMTRMSRLSREPETEKVTVSSTNPIAFLIRSVVRGIKRWGKSTTEQVVTRLDWIGMIVFVGYLVVRFSSKRFFSHRSNGAELQTVCLAFLL